MYLSLEEIKIERLASLILSHNEDENKLTFCLFFILHSFYLKLIIDKFGSDRNFRLIDVRMMNVMSYCNDT